MNVKEFSLLLENSPNSLQGKVHSFFDGVFLREDLLAFGKEQILELEVVAIEPEARPYVKLFVRDEEEYLKRVSKKIGKPVFTEKTYKRSL